MKRAYTTWRGKVSHEVFARDADGNVIRENGRRVSHREDLTVELSVALSDLLEYMGARAGGSKRGVSSALAGKVKSKVLARKPVKTEGAA